MLVQFLQRSVKQTSNTPSQSAVHLHYRHCENSSKENICKSNSGHASQNLYEGWSSDSSAIKRSNDPFRVGTGTFAHSLFDGIHHIFWTVLFKSEQQSHVFGQIQLMTSFALSYLMYFFSNLSAIFFPFKEYYWESPVRCSDWNISQKLFFCPTTTYSGLCSSDHPCMKILFQVGFLCLVRKKIEVRR